MTIPYIGGYYVAYEYDEESGAYTRLMLGEEHKDKESGNTLIAHNVLIAKTAHRIVDGEGRREVNVRGPGEGYLIQRGQVREITWERVDGIIRAFENGRELPWVPGKTWIHIIPQGSEVTFE